MLRFLKHVLIMLAVLWVGISFYIGGKFDEICIEGRLSSEQAEVINLLHWGKCPKYRHDECMAEAGDRVLVGECSKFFKTIWNPSRWINIWWR